VPSLDDAANKAQAESVEYSMTAAGGDELIGHDPAWGGEELERDRARTVKV